MLLLFISFFLFFFSFFCKGVWLSSLVFVRWRPRMLLRSVFKIVFNHTAHRICWELRRQYFPPLLGMHYWWWLISQKQAVWCSCLLSSFDCVCVVTIHFFYITPVTCLVCSLNIHSIRSMAGGLKVVFVFGCDLDIGNILAWFWNTFITALSVFIGCLACSLLPIYYGGFMLLFWVCLCVPVCINFFILPQFWCGIWVGSLRFSGDNPTDHSISKKHSKGA